MGVHAADLRRRDCKLETFYCFLLFTLKTFQKERFKWLAKCILRSALIKLGPGSCRISASFHSCRSRAPCYPSPTAVSVRVPAQLRRPPRPIRPPGNVEWVRARVKVCPRLWMKQAVDAAVQDFRLFQEILGKPGHPLFHIVDTQETFPSSSFLPSEYDVSVWEPNWQDDGHIAGIQEICIQEKQMYEIMEKVRNQETRFLVSWFPIT